jgi:NTP pyrophosphatase (non-canonical NTP hydrolase)
MPGQRRPSSLNGSSHVVHTSDVNQFSLLNKLAEQCLEDSARWFPGHTNNSLTHHVLALAGEVGEVANIVKKLERGDLSLGNPAVVHHLREEVADVFIYLLNIAGIMKVDLYKAYCEKRAINEKRWGNK